MDEEQLKAIVIEAWEEWKNEQEIVQIVPAEKQRFKQWWGYKTNAEVPENVKFSREFALDFFACNESLAKGFSVDDIQIWVKQKQANDGLDNAMKEMTDDIMPLVKSHLSTLLKKRRRLLIKNEYGFIDDKKWQKELCYFADQAIIPYLKETMINIAAHKHLVRLAYDPGNEIYFTKYDPKDDRVIYNDGEYLLAGYLGEVRQCLNQCIDIVLNNNMGETTGQRVDISLLDPNEYEHFCADLLEKIGWDTRVTQASGDQGIDVLAKKDGFLLALQCKKYSSPVGNKAVQEAFSGGTFYEAKAFAVVSPVEYTSSAKELANSLGVLLLHHDDLSGLTVTGKE